MGAYSQDKALQHTDRLAILAGGGQPYPVHVQCVISDLCNQSCRFCGYRLDGYSSNQLFHILEADGTKNNNPRRMIPWEKLQEIVDDCAAMGVKAIQLTGGGEPTVHPQFDDLCELILSRGIKLAVVTNGLLLKPKRLEILKRAAWVRVSVDCSNRETYAKVRQVPPAEFDVVSENVKRFAAMKRRATLGVGYVVTQGSYAELHAACRLFKSWGVDNVRVSAMFQNDGANYFRDIHAKVRKQIDSAKQLEDGRFRVFDNFGSRFSDLKQGRPDYADCGVMHFTTYIGGDQNVYTCCVNAYNERGLIGSLKSQRFKELWDSRAKQDYFDGFDARNCERCMFNEKNRAINGAIAETAHDAFV